MGSYSTPIGNLGKLEYDWKPINGHEITTMFFLQLQVRSNSWEYDWEYVIILGDRYTLDGYWGTFRSLAVNGDLSIYKPAHKTWIGYAWVRICYVDNFSHMC